MTRLDKMENLYLNILRVTILILATVFLIGATFGLINALPKLIPAIGGSDVRKMVSDTTYKDYKDSQGSVSSGATVGAESSGTEAAQTDKIDSRIATASKNFVSWGTKTGSNYDLAAVEKALDTKQKSLNDSLQGDYADSLVQFSRDVLASAGSEENINQLLDWHLAKFSTAQARAAESEQARALKTAAERQEALLLAGAAGAAFLAFLILVFVFVLVKIERNLRIVVVQGAPGERPPLTAAKPA